ncbi:MAG: TIGR04452 family lipoprotein [Spirochaetales bacterium]|nr:TIGR04452 family lipoprotein [Spirochaetales bacterium]
MNSKKILFSILLGFVLSGLPSCLITNELGLSPLDSYSGEETKVKISDAALISFFIADGLIDSKYSNQKPNTMGKILYGAVNGLIYRAQLGVDDNRYYTMDSVDACVDVIHFKGALWLKLFTENYYNSLQNNSNAGEGLPATQIYAPQFSGKDCKLDETGKVVHITPALSL